MIYDYFLQYIIHIKLFILDIEEIIINDDNIDIEIKRKECSINISFTIDLLYNIIVCKNNGIELSFE